MHFVALLTAFIAAASAAEQPIASVQPQAQQTGGFFADIIKQCSQQDMATCLQIKAIRGLERASRSENLSVMDSVNVVRIPGTRPDREGRSLSQEELDQASARGTLTDLLWERLANFMSSHTVTVQLPQLTPDQLKQGVEEGRGKMKKMMSMMMLAGMMKAATMIPIKLGALFLLAGKALIVSKLALVLSLIILLKKLMSSKGDEMMMHHGGGGWAAQAATGGWDRRSMKLVRSDLPYRAHIQYSTH